MIRILHMVFIKILFQRFKEHQQAFINKVLYLVILMEYNLKVLLKVLIVVFKYLEILVMKILIMVFNKVLERYKEVK